MKTYWQLGADAPATTATTAILRIVEDPYLQETACEVIRLSNAVRTGRPGPACARTDPRHRNSPKGIGLQYAVGPLRMFITHKQQPWLIPTLVAATLGLVFLAGYAVGRRRTS